MSQMFKVRSAKAEDLPFILNSWLKRYRDAISVRLVTDRVYYEKQNFVIKKILAAEGLRVLVACDPQDENLIYGYTVGEFLSDDWCLVHWTYCKGPFRKFGIGKSLVDQLIGTANKVQYTHKTHLVDFLFKGREVSFNPFYVWALV